MVCAQRSEPKSHNILFQQPYQRFFKSVAQLTAIFPKAGALMSAAGDTPAHVTDTTTSPLAHPTRQMAYLALSLLLPTVLTPNPARPTFPENLDSQVDPTFSERVVGPLALTHLVSDLDTHTLQVRQPQPLPILSSVRLVIAHAHPGCCFRTGRHSAPNHIAIPEL